LGLYAQSPDDCAAVAADFKRRASQYQRTIKCVSYPFVLWRETEREAKQERRKLLDQMDREGVENFARAMGINSGSYDLFTLKMLALGAGAMPVIGTKEQVAEKLAKLYRNGLDGMLLVFLSYLEDTLRFEREILPLLEQLDVR
jgi:dimethylsulfone monooxygenase